METVPDRGCRVAGKGDLNRSGMDPRTLSGPLNVAGSTILVAQWGGRDGVHYPPVWLTRKGILAVAAILSVGVLAIDWRIHDTSSPAVFYTGIVVLIAFGRHGRLIVPAAVLFTVMTWIGWAIKPAGDPLWHSIVARTIVCGVIWLMARLMLWRERLRQRRRPAATAM